MINSSEQMETRRRAQEAKEYLIAQIVEEAQRENVELSELERKMLYFTESEETLPDIYDVNDQFEQEYDDAEYEAKISCLLRNARRRVREESTDGGRLWKEAERDLRKEDHYLGVMVGQSHEGTGNVWGVMKWAVLTMVVMSTGFYLDEKGLIPTWMRNLPPLVWMLGVCAFILGAVLLQKFSPELKLLIKKTSRD